MNQSRGTVSVWLLASILATLVLWLGCEQKGEISPTGTGRNALTFIDTVIVDPPLMGLGETANIHARVLDETNEPARNEPVRFSVNRGVLAGSRPDTTVNTDLAGWARTQFTAPNDSGTVLLRTELLSMAEQRTSTIRVSASGMLEGLLTLWTEADTLFADNGMSRSRIYARLRNESNNPIAGAPIYFSTTVGTISSPVLTDTLTGTATSTLVSTTETGLAVIIARHGNSSDTARVRFLTPAAAGSITVTSGRSLLTAGMDSTLITARVADERGFPVVDNTVIHFSTNRGVLSRATILTSGGIATTMLYASPTTGVATVQASAGGSVNGSVAVEIVAGPTASVTVLSSADTLDADNSSQAAITAIVRDSNGNGVAQGTPVSFTAQGGVVNETATVGPDGRATTTFRAGLVPGSAAVTANQAGIRGSAVIYLRPTMPAAIQLNVNPRQLVADGVSESALRATVLDAQGRPVSDGTNVTFTSLTGQIAGNSPLLGGKDRRAAAADKSAWASTMERRFNSGIQNLSRAESSRFARTQSLYTTTTVNGYAYATLTSATLAGTDTIAASAAEYSVAQSVTYVAGTPALIHVQPASGSLPADGVSSTVVTCRVSDSNGNPVGSGIAVAVNPTLGRAAPASGFTNSGGEFVTTLTTERRQGTCALVATAGTASGYGQVVFTVPSAAAVQLSSSAAMMLANGIANVTLTAYVQDSYGLPVPQSAVTWQAGAGIGRMTVLSATTDSLGRATALFTSGASRVDAVQSVTAGASGYTDTRNLTMTGVTVESWPEQTQLPANGSSTTPVNVLVRETSSGMGIAGATVRFAVTHGSITLSAVTNSSGIATATYTSGRQSGEVVVTSVYGDTLRAQCLLRLTGVEADTLVVTLGQAELLADGVSSTTATAYVYNEGGQAVPNTPVTFTATGGGSFFPVTVVSDANGRAVSTYLSSASPTDVQVVVDVAIERANDEKQLRLRGVTLDAQTATTVLPANGTATASIQISLRRTSDFVGISNAAIQLGANLGTIPATITTDGSGLATVTFRAGTQAGEAVIIARYGNLLTDTTRITLFAPAAAQLALASAASSLLANGEATSALTTTIVDQTGAPLRNAAVQWTVSGGGQLGSAISLTDSNGIARNIYTTPASIGDGTATIRAISGAIGDSVIIGVRGVTVDFTSQYGSLPANGVSTSQMQAHIIETTSRQAVNGAAVFFGSSLGYIPASATTGTSGTATVSLRAGTTPGSATVVCRYGNQLADTVIVTFYSPVPVQAVAFADTSLLRANGIASTPVRAFIYDAMNVPLGGIVVTWSSTYGSLSATQTLTDAAGIATVTYQTGASMSDRTVNVTATAGAAQASAQVMERGITVAVTATPETVIADGSSTSMIRAHIFETTTSVAVSNALVNFGTTLGTIPNSAITGSNGMASVQLTSATQTGTAAVTVRYGNLLMAQVNVAFAPSTPTTLSLTASPTVLMADNVSTSTLTAVVTDQNGNPVPNGTQIRFSIPPQSGSLENLRITQGGVAINTLTSSTTPDTVRVVAWAESHLTARDSVTVIYRVGPPAVITLSAQSDTLSANGIAVDTITAHVTDVVGHVLPNIEVRFASTIGNITQSRVTDANGNARVAFSSSQTGTAQITATAGTAQAQYTIYLIPGLPNSIELEYFPGSVGVRGSGRNETLLITATVRDANNNPVLDGTSVRFNINNSPGGGDFLSSTGIIPTINGRATVSYNSGTVSGSVRIRATCGTVSAVSTEILIYAGPPFIENVAQGCNTSHMSLAPSPCSMFGMDVVGDSVTLVALVGDRYNNPVTPGTAVYFTTSGGVITTATGYTDSSGFARVRLFSGNPLPTIERWMNTLSDPNTGAPILCSPVPPQPGMAKVLAQTAGVDATGDSVMVWAATNVIFDYAQPNLFLRSATVNGDPNLRTLYIGQNALIRIATYDRNFWPIVAGSTISFSANHGNIYPNRIVVGCPGDTTYTVSYFNNLGLADDDAASPVLITVDTRYGDAYTFTETFTLRASLPPGP